MSIKLLKYLNNNIQLISYFGLTYLISWTIWLPLYGPVFGWNSFSIFPFHHGMGGLGPLVAAFVTTWIFLKTEGLKKLLTKCIQFKPLLYLLIALFSPFILAFFSSLLSYFIDKTPINLNGLFKAKEFPQFNLMTFFFYNLLFFGCGEEVGWRGFALPRLQNKFTALTSSLILTLFWALWHLPLFFYRPGYITMDIAGTIGWIFSLLTGSILLTWLYNSARGSILICAVFHTTIDIAFTADIANKNLVNYMGFLITVWGVLTIIIFRTKNLAANTREVLPNDNGYLKLKNTIDEAA